MRTRTCTELENHSKESAYRRWSRWGKLCIDVQRLLPFLQPVFSHSANDQSTHSFKAVGAYYTLVIRKAILLQCTSRIPNSLRLNLTMAMTIPINPDTTRRSGPRHQHPVRHTFEHQRLLVRLTAPRASTASKNHPSLAQAFTYQALGRTVSCRLSFGNKTNS